MRSQTWTSVPSTIHNRSTSATVRGAGFIVGNGRSRWMTRQAEKPAPPNKLTADRVWRGFRNLRARTGPQPVHRNRLAPVPDDHLAPRTATRLPVTT